ncbi:MAG: hypothetical protein NTV88_05330 [Candidatus Micrarchaeota archaeon]|nr:hypothetical protein [Candidatus Micrarchaeota archaeon]
MLKPVKMSKVRAICLKQVAPSVIKSLQSMSVVHLKDSQLPETTRAGPLASYDDISARLIRIRSMKESLGKTGKLPKKKISFPHPLKEADELLQENEKLLSILKEKEELGRELEANLAAQKSLADMADLNIDFSKMQSESLQFVLIRASTDKQKAAADVLSKKKNCSFTQAGSAMLIALPKKEDAKFLESFGQFLPLPALESTPKHEISTLKEKESAIREKISSAQSKQQRFSDTHYPRLAALEEDLSIEADRAKTSTLFSATESLYYIEGYVEATKFKHLALELHKQFGKKVHIYEAGIDSHKDTVPTLLSNPKQAMPFQFIVSFLSLPQYSEIDPTLFIALFTPILYALIFGDALYAVLSFLIATYLIKISKSGAMLNQVAKIWQLSAIPAFIAGVAFDEWFGFTHQHLLAKFGIQGTFYQAYMHRVADVQTLMLLVIIIGAVHLAIGFILGAINEWNHSRKHAIAKLCWLGTEISGFFLVAVFMFNSFTFLSTPSLALFALSVAGLIWSEGPIALFEIPGLASNIMSYIRIAAVGLGGVILAEAINELLFPHLELTIPGIIIFIITIIAYLSIHAIACIIAMFESFVHGARLNVVEFFGKFYKGNGLPFAPFSAMREYTEET